MNYDELRDKAYRIATANSTCETLSYEDFQNIPDVELEAIYWEPFEHWTAGETREHIDRMAQDIIDAFTSLVTEK